MNLSYFSTWLIKNGWGINKRLDLEKHLDTEVKIECYFRNKKDKTVILFADLADSTLYKQQRSFVKGLYKTRQHNLVVSDIIRKYGGGVVKYIGDAVMARFDVGKHDDNAYIALLAAIAIQEQFDQINYGITDVLEKIQSKIGISCGIIADFYGNDPQGQVVDLAARIESNARPNQILVHKSIIETVNINKLVSKFGVASKWCGRDYISTPVKLKLKGIPEPQEIVELRWNENFLGIKSENEYNEYWEDYRYDATLCDLDEDSVPKAIKDRYFRIIFDLRYTTILKKKTFPFVLVDSIEDLNEAMKNGQVFSRYMLPRQAYLSCDLRKIFRIEFMRVNDYDLYEVPSDETIKKAYFVRTYQGDTVQSLVGRKVTIHYRIDSIIAKRGNFFAMLTEYPVKGLSMNFDMGATNIRVVRPIDYFATPINPKFIYTPTKDNARKIEVTINDWVYPRGGVVFVWDLDT